jgi:hypothetical protein
MMDNLEGLMHGTSISVDSAVRRSKELARLLITHDAISDDWIE